MFITSKVVQWKTAIEWAQATGQDVLNSGDLCSFNYYVIHAMYAYYFDLERAMSLRVSTTMILPHTALYGTKTTV